MNAMLDGGYECAGNKEAGRKEMLEMAKVVQI